ncbi:MAG: OmpA family protein [Cyclobacteriaceae bacterium]
MTESTEKWKYLLCILWIPLMAIAHDSQGQVTADSAYAIYYGKIISASTKAPVEAKIRYESLPYSSMIGFKRNDEITFPMDQQTDYLITISAEGYSPYVTTIRNSQIRDHELRQVIELVPNRVDEVIRLENLIFAQGRAQINPESYKELDQLAEMLHANPNMVIQLEGHTDFRGDEKENMKLSEKRVEAVKGYLMDKGIEGSRIATKAFGGSQPLSRDSDAASRRSNRRVEVRILSN